MTAKESLNNEVISYLKGLKADPQSKFKTAVFEDAISSLEKNEIVIPRNIFGQSEICAICWNQIEDEPSLQTRENILRLLAFTAVTLQIKEVRELQDLCHFLRKSIGYAAVLEQIEKGNLLSELALTASQSYKKQS